MLSTAELHWESSGFSTALPLLLQALALARQHHLQSLASETILHLAFTQVRWTDFTVTAPIYAIHQSHLFLHYGWRIEHAWFIWCLCFFSFLQLMLGVSEQALSVLHEAIEPVLAHGAVMDKGRALLLTARCQMAVAGFRPNGQGQAGNSLGAPLPNTDPYLVVSRGCTASIYTLLLIVSLQICVWQLWLLTR